MMGRSDARILSRPCPVYFAGFETTTTRLQQEGWELTVEQDIRDCRMRLLMRFQPAGLYMLSEEARFDYFRNADMRFGGPDVTPEFHVRKVSSKMVVQLMERSFSFQAIDAQPTFTEAPRKSVEDFGFFAAPLVRTEEIIVEPETVSDLLAKIKSMQAPELAAIRERNRRRAQDQASLEYGAMQQTKFHAQIVSLAA